MPKWEWTDTDDGFPCRVKYYGDGSSKPWMDIKFQANPVKEVGVNGMCMLDILDSMIFRLSDFQSKWACEENLKAMEAMSLAKAWLRAKRDRRSRAS